MRSQRHQTAFSPFGIPSTSLWMGTGGPWANAVRGGLSKHVDLKLVSRLEFGSGAAAMRYEFRTWLSGSRQPSCSVFMSSRPDQFAAASEYRA